MLRKIAFLFCLSTVLAEDISVPLTPDQQLDMAIAITENGQHSKDLRIATLKRYSEGLIFAILSPEQKSRYKATQNDRCYPLQFGAGCWEDIRDTFLDYSASMLELIYIAAGNTEASKNDKQFISHQKNLWFFCTHGVVVVLPIVTKDGLLPEELINRAMSHRIALMGCALNPKVSYDGHDGTPYKLAIHDIEHVFFNETNSYLLGAYRQAFLQRYDICRQLCSLLPQDHFYSLNHYWIFYLIHERAFFTPKKSIASRQNQPNYHEIDINLTRETFISASTHFLDESTQNFWKIKADLTPGNKENIIYYDYTTNTWNPPPSEALRLAVLLKEKSKHPEAVLYNYNYRQLMDMENALHARGILDFSIWVEGTFNGQGMIDVLTREIKAFQSRLIGYDGGQRVLI